MNNKIRYTEIFYSLQGEGQYVGVPSIFFRTFGCNFRCKKFGIPRDQEIGTYNPEVEAILKNGLDSYKEFKDLPLVQTGCDSYTSIYPEFKKFAKTEDVKFIIDQFQELLPEGKFGRDKHLIITGGEPLLGWQRSYPALLDEIINRGMNLTHITFETNGTQLLNDEFKQYLDKIAQEHKIEITYSLSCKLPCSGEAWEDAIKPDVVKQYLETEGNRSYFKFVVATAQDVEDAHRAIAEYAAAGIDIPVYLMPVGGVNSVYDLNERQVADYCRDNGLRFSPRIQVPLYKNAWNT